MTTGVRDGMTEGMTEATGGIGKEIETTRTGASVADAPPMTMTMTALNVVPASMFVAAIRSFAPSAALENPRKPALMRR
jgi:hypothetical protein